MKMKRIVMMTVASRGLVEGINRYSRLKSDWLFEWIEPSRKQLAALQDAGVEGFIGYLADASMLEAAQRLGCPVVNHSGALETCPVPRVCIDSRAAGRLAAEHFLERGFSRFACLGAGRPAFSRERRTGFADVLAEHGYPCEVHEMGAVPRITAHSRSRAADKKLGNWLNGLERPTGLFAINDTFAWWATEVARETGIHVPEDIAILGMDNNALCCVFSRPRLSSIVSPFDRIGYECAALLDRLMAGGPSGVLDLRIPPTSIAVRQSTDILALQDRGVSRALRFIREHAAESIRVADAARAAGMSRRSLEMRFKRALGRTVLSELNRHRLERAKMLLLETTLTVEDIATRSGFSSARWMHSVFRKTFGAAPGAYRRKHGAIGRQAD
jgi:LacI family transcriptional regulator